MAGGSGERFWPVSRRTKPKQLLRLTSESKTMLEESVERVKPLISPEDVYVVTGLHLLDAIRSGDASVPDENVIAEPCKRNTAGCLAFAAAHILAKYGGDGSNITMAVMTADHQIGEIDLFIETIGTAMDAAEKQDALVVLGVAPSRAETGYGYIEADNSLKPLDGISGDVNVYSVDAFHEKPDKATAEAFVKSGHHFWNSGMFFWTIASFLRELETASPSHAEAVRSMAKAMSANDEEAVNKIFDELEDISIDYALMEKAERVLVVRAEFPWDDVGAWTAIERARESDSDGNVTQGDPVLVDCQDCIVYNDSGSDNMVVGVVGVKDLVVVATPDAVLVVPKDRAQDAKKIVEELKRRNAKQL